MIIMDLTVLKVIFCEKYFLNNNIFKRFFKEYGTTKKDKCRYFYCKNGGSCYTNYNGDAYCVCPDGYYGTKCES